MWANGYGRYTNNTDGILRNIEVKCVVFREPGFLVELDGKTHQSCTATCLSEPYHGGYFGAAEVWTTETGQVTLGFTCLRFQPIRHYGVRAISRPAKLPVLLISYGILPFIIATCPSMLNGTPEFRVVSLRRAFLASES
jgi:hypothetical protein